MFCCVDKNRRPNARGTIVSHSFASRSASLRARYNPIHPPHASPRARAVIVDRRSSPHPRRASLDATRTKSNPSSLASHAHHPPIFTIVPHRSIAVRAHSSRARIAMRARIQSSHPSPVRPTRTLATSITHRGLEQFIVVLTRARGDGALGASRGRLRDDSRAGERGGGRRGEHRGKVTPRPRWRRGASASVEGDPKPPNPPIMTQRVPPLRPRAPYNTPIEPHRRTSDMRVYPCVYPPLLRG